MIALRRGAALALLVLAFVPSTARAQTALTLDALKSATYPVALAPGGTATLANGHFEVAAAPGSASKTTVDLVTSALGTINGQPGAVVVLASSGGGSGVFFDVYALDSNGRTLAKDSLGDRIRVQSVAINAAGLLVVDLFTHGPGEALSSATLPEHREYSVRGGVLFRADPPRPAATGTGGLANTQSSVAFEATAIALVILGVAFARRRTGDAR